MRRAIYTLIAAQFLAFAAEAFNGDRAETAIEKAAAAGQSTFAAQMTHNIWDSSETNFTMVNGWRSETVPNQCSVNLIKSDTGKPLEDTVGYLWDMHPPARRFVIKDCRKLPDSIYRTLVIR